MHDRTTDAAISGDRHASRARVLSVNVGSVREVEWRGQLVTTGIWKHPVAGRIALRGVNFDGDDQADRTVHGGPDKAVYAYSVEDYAHWRADEGVETPPGLFGENLTVEGVDLSAVVAGERWRVGSTLLEAAQPRMPCYKLGVKFGRADMIRRFLASGRTGFYFAVLREGEVGAGDEIEPVAREERRVTVADVVRVYAHERGDFETMRRAVEVEALPEGWRDEFLERIGKASSPTGQVRGERES